MKSKGELFDQKKNRKVRKDKRHENGSQRLYEGDIKYIIIASSEQIEDMKCAASDQNISIKEAFATAMSEYLLKHGSAK